MIAVASLAAAFAALVDARLRPLALAAFVLAMIALFRDRSRPFVPVLTLCLLVLFRTGFALGADSTSYFAYTSSLIADRDLDLANQRIRLQRSVESTPTHRERNVFSVGPGLIWIPAVVLTHAWLRATGEVVDPLLIGPSYYTAAAATTLAVVLGGLFVLSRVLAVRFGQRIAWLATLTVVLASPVLHYAFVQPMMSHALTFGAAALTVALTLRAETEPRTRLWLACGAALGLTMLFRTQSAVLGLFVAVGLWRARAGWRNAVVTGTAALVIFTPQMLAWRVMYGSFLTVPQGSGFIDWKGRHAIDVLISADHGLFNWHPALIVGLVGLFIARPSVRRLSLAALVIFAFTAFLNGSVRDWNGSDSFGARRFDVVLPLLALGVATFLERSRPLLESRPLLAPAMALAFAGLWNASLIDARRTMPQSAMPMDEVVRIQAAQARRAADFTIGAMGPRSRDLIYRVFVGLFMYHDYRLGGDFDLATLEPRFLKDGWSQPFVWDDGVAYRYLMHPQGCIVIPIDEPFDLRGSVLARSPARVRDQRLSIVLNGTVLAEAALPSDWTEIPFQAPASRWVGGENHLCLRSAKTRPGDENDDLAYAAAVVRVQLP